LLAVGLVFIARAPVRRSTQSAAGGPPSFRPIVRDLLHALVARPALGLVMIGGAGLAYASASALHGITWLVQERGFEFSRATYTAGIMAIGSGFIGNVAGGGFADWCQRRWRGGRSWSLVMLTLFFAPFNTAFFLLPPASPLFYVAWFFSSMSTVAYFGPVFSAVQELAPAHIRSSTVAFALLVMNLLGVGPGPWITGIIGDRASLTSGLLASVGAGVAMVAVFALAARLTDHASATERMPDA
jgi:MFS family permease